jgi:hypothetical protein
MEEAAEPSNYLPLSFKSPKEHEYIEFLWEAFATPEKLAVTGTALRSAAALGFGRAEICKVHRRCHHRVLVAVL